MIRYLLGISFVGMLSGLPTAAAAPPIEAYGRLPSMSYVSMSPSGERYAFVATDGEQRKLVIADSNNKPLAMSNVGDSKVRSIDWAGEDHVLVTTSAALEIGYDFTAPLHEFAGVIVLNVRSNHVFEVFGGEHKYKVVNAVLGSFGTRQIDGHWYGWYGGMTYTHAKGNDNSKYHYTGTDVLGNSASDFQRDYPDLYRVDLDTGDLVLVAPGSEDSNGWLVGSDGTVAARAVYNQRSGNWQVLAGRDDLRVLASGQSEFDGTDYLHIGRSPETILAALPVDGAVGQRGGYRYREISLKDGSDRPLPDGRPIKDLLFDPVDHHWIGNTVEDDNRDTVLLPDALAARWHGAIKAFPNNRAHLISWSTDFNKMVVKTDGGDDSGTFWIVDIAQHSADPIGAEYPGVKSADVGPVQMVDWRAPDGLMLHGVLTLPPGRPAKSLPVVVLPHGGPVARDYPGFDWWAQAYASRGYAVLQPNFRGSSGYGVAFANAGLGEWGRKMQTDISDGLAALAAKGIVDPKRACIVGASYGGYAALAGVTVQHGLYRCAVSVAGVSDLREFLGANDPWVRYKPNGSTRFWKAFMGVTSATVGSQLDPISPVALADRADAPILLIHGKDDTVVPLKQSQLMQRALEHAGKPVEFVLMDNEDHWLSREQTRVAMLKAAISFVEKHNPAN